MATPTSELRTTTTAHGSSLATTAPALDEAADVTSPAAQKARDALSDALAVTGPLGSLGDRLTSTWVEVLDSDIDFAASGWVEDCCGVRVAAAEELLISLHSLSDACGSHSLLPVESRDAMDASLNEIEESLSRFASAGSQRQAISALAEASAGLLDFNSRLAEVTRLGVNTFLDAAGSPSARHKDDALRSVADLLTSITMASEELKSMLDTVIAEPGLVGTPDWAGQCCGSHLANIDAIYLDLRSRADVCEAFAWVPCQITIDLKSQVDAAEAAMADFKSSDDFLKAASAIAVAASAMANTSEPAAELIRIDICALEGGLHPGAGANVADCAW